MELPYPHAIGTCECMRRMDYPAARRADQTGMDSGCWYTGFHHTLSSASRTGPSPVSMRHLAGNQADKTPHEAHGYWENSEIATVSHSTFAAGLNPGAEHRFAEQHIREKPDRCFWIVE